MEVDGLLPCRLYKLLIVRPLPRFAKFIIGKPPAPHDYVRHTNSVQGLIKWTTIKKKLRNTP